MALNRFQNPGQTPTRVDELTSQNIGVTTVTSRNTYVSGPIQFSNTVVGDHVIGTAFNGLLAGPVNIQGSIEINGVLVVV